MKKEEEDHFLSLFQCKNQLEVLKTWYFPYWLFGRQANGGLSPLPAPPSSTIADWC